MTAISSEGGLECGSEGMRGARTAGWADQMQRASCCADAVTSRSLVVADLTTHFHEVKLAFLHESAANKRAITACLPLEDPSRMHVEGRAGGKRSSLACLRNRKVSLDAVSERSKRQALVRVRRGRQTEERMREEA